MLENVDAAPKARGLRLLLIEDEPDLRDYYRSLIEGLGIEVTPVGTAHDGAKAANERTFDVAIVDERLPDNRGVALLRWMRRRFPQTRLILFSAFADWEMYFRGCGAGAIDVLSKGCPAQELIRVIRTCAPKI